MRDSVSDWPSPCMTPVLFRKAVPLRSAGLSRAAFFDALGRHGVTPFQYDNADELLADAQAARL